MKSLKRPLHCHFECSLSCRLSAAEHSCLFLAETIKHDNLAQLLFVGYVLKKPTHSRQWTTYLLKYDVCRFLRCNNTHQLLIMLAKNEYDKKQRNKDKPKHWLDLKGILFIHPFSTTLYPFARSQGSGANPNWQLDDDAWRQTAILTFTPTGKLLSPINPSCMKLEHPRKTHTDTRKACRLQTE